MYNYFKYYQVISSEEQKKSVYECYTLKKKLIIILKNLELNYPIKQQQEMEWKISGLRNQYKDQNNTASKQETVGI